MSRPLPQSYGMPPVRSNRTPVVIEAIAALFGLFGLGWLYAGRNPTGILLLVGGILWDAIGVALLSTGIGAVCFLPIHVILVTISAARLSSSIRRFGYI
jgi:TM2 domain-containing membrane protein YozV